MDTASVRICERLDTAEHHIVAAERPDHLEAGRGPPRMGLLKD
jgi:hypothetical protein